MGSHQGRPHAPRRMSPILSIRLCMHLLSMGATLLIIALLCAAAVAEQADIGRCSRLPCRTKVVWGFDPALTYSPCKCGPFGLSIEDGSPNGCVCGPCHQLAGGTVFASNPVSDRCRDSLNCEGCYRYYMSEASSDDQSGSTSQSPAPTSTAPASTTSTPSSTSPAPFVTQPAAQTKTSSSSNSNGVFTAVIMIVISVVLGTVLGVTIWYYRRIQSQGNSSTPREEPEYVVIVQSVSDSPHRSMI